MRRKNKRRKIPQKFCYLAYSMYLCPDKEPLKQAGGSASSGLTIRVSRQNTEIRRFPNCNLENCVISQTSDKQRWFEISSKVTKKAEKWFLFLFYSLLPPLVWIPPDAACLPDGLRGHRPSCSPQKDWVYKWDSKERKDVLDHIDYHQFSLTENPENKITIRVAFK